MRLGLTFSSSFPDAKASWYSIMVYDDAGNCKGIGPDEREFLRSQRQRIETMAKRLLGSDFMHLDDSSQGPGSLDLCVRIGTSTGDNRFNFQSFAGWVGCFALEIPAGES